LRDQDLAALARAEMGPERVRGVENGRLRAFVDRLQWGREETTIKIMIKIKIRIGAKSGARIKTRLCRA
jgi:hypothetical protein